MAGKRAEIGPGTRIHISKTTFYHMKFLNHIFLHLHVSLAGLETDASRLTSRVSSTRQLKSVPALSHELNSYQSL